ncbi:MAG: phosphotransferase, partial [Planctomycetales bacterium]
LFDADLQSAPRGNWVGVARVPPEESAAYCNVAVADGRVVEIRDKQRCDDSYRAFTGLFHVADHAEFWGALARPVLVQNEHQLGDGLRGLMEGPGLAAFEIDWTDVGGAGKYRAAVEARIPYDFSKSGEFLYFVGERVIKFFDDPAIVARRVAKARLKPDCFPEIAGVADQFYAYRFQPGHTLYERNSPALFRKLLAWLDRRLWTPAEVEPQRMRDLCREFYRDKTLARLAEYERKHAGDLPRRFNDAPLPLARELLDRVDWDELSEGVPRFIHGDLHFENLVYDPEADRFVLLDWRQDFAGEIAFGDWYYDLAKLHGGLVLNQDYIRRGLFSVERQGDGIFVDFAVRFTSADHQRILAEYVAARRLDLERIRLLSALIYLNMAPLHHPPFDEALYALGTKLLADELERKR